MKLKLLVPSVQAFVEFYEHSKEVSLTRSWHDLGSLCSHHPEVTAAVLAKRLIKGRDAISTRREVHGNTDFIATMENCCRLLRQLKQPKPADALEKIGNALELKYFPTVTDAVAAAELALSQPVAPKASPAAVKADIVEKYVTLLMETLLDARKFAEVLAELTADKKNARKQEVCAIASRLQGVQTAKNKTRDSYLDDIQARHIVDMRQAGKDEANSRRGRSWGA